MKLDAYVLSIVQKFAHFVERWTGINNFKLAVGCWIAVAAMLIAPLVSLFLEGEVEGLFNYVVVSVVKKYTSIYLCFIGAILYMGFWVVPRQESLYEQYPELGNLNRQDPKEVGVRLLFLGCGIFALFMSLYWFAIGSGDIKLAIWVILMPLANYLVACQPLPPRQQEDENAALQAS